MRAIKNYNIIKNLVKSKIQVMGHIGFTPQFKKFNIEGNDYASKRKLIKEALEIERAGSFQLYWNALKDTSKKYQRY